MQLFRKQLSDPSACLSVMSGNFSEDQIAAYLSDGYEIATDESLAEARAWAEQMVASGQWVPTVPETSPAEVAAALERAATEHSQQRLDGLAHSWGYDNITTLRSAALSSVPRFLAEGQAGQAAWDAEWSAAQAFRTSALAGEIEPTLEAYIAALPALPDRPTP